MNILIFGVTGIIGIALGYLCFVAILKLLKKRLSDGNKEQAELIIKEAQARANRNKLDAITQEEEEIEISKEDFEAELKADKEEFEEIQGSFEEREAHLATQESRLQSTQDRLKNREKKLEIIRAEVENSKESLGQAQINYVTKLVNRTGTKPEETKAKIQRNIVESRSLECQKVLKGLEGELSSSAKKLAYRSLDRVNARYAPNFIWPKPSNIVEVGNPNTFDLLSVEDSPILRQLSEISGSEVKILGAPEGNNIPILKFGGGFGIYREAARKTAEELVHQPKSAWKKVDELYKSHRESLETQAVILGKQAVNELRLKEIHPEIQKLVGALNWRTSYRQNQWYHTVEVAILAGIIASELGVDPEEAKRVGMLHDIGKAIDYRIEGSHAVISGDYADRYGETRLICDTVMSHHADLRVESPLAYVLRAADTLSGARPGARVNLEEGYQIRLTAISDAVWSFKGISDLAIMNGGREIHVQVHHKKVKENEVSDLASEIARKIEEEVAFPGQIKVLVSRNFESISVA